MAFVKGQSGNPAGRRAGTKNKKTLLREELEKDGSALAVAIKAAALKPDSPDSTAMSLWLSRLEPPLRPSAQRVQFDLNPDAPIADQAKQIMLAMSRGELDPDTARQIMDMLSAFIGMKDVETVIEELKRLRTAKPHIPGGIVET
ncbi:MAG: DUF5681 domain-containing protein [Steroidobacteraceae bacterium]